MVSTAPTVAGVLFRHGVEFTNQENELAGEEQSLRAQLNREHADAKSEAKAASSRPAPSGGRAPIRMPTDQEHTDRRVAGISKLRDSHDGRRKALRDKHRKELDFEARAIHVRQRADRYNAIGRPKSEAGERTVPGPPLVLNALREWRLACPKGTRGLVFPNGAGNVESLANIHERGWHPVQVAAGVVNQEGKAKYSGLHSLRHFFASWCINRKADGGLELPGKVAQERLGHSTIAMTMDTYGHLFPRGDDGAELAAAERSLFSV